MALSIYTMEQAEEWDKIVRSFVDYDVYYLNGYVKAFQLHGDGDPLLIYYESNDCRGMNVVMKRDIAEDCHFADKIQPKTLYDLITPYGYGGWLIEGDKDNSALFDAYENWCSDNNIVSEFVRYHPVLENHVYSESIYQVSPLSNTITMDLSDPETIWSNLTSKNRNMIRKAQKAGIVIYNGRYPKIYKKFRSIYDKTMIRNGASDYYFFGNAFYKSILNDLSAEGQVFYAELDGKVIASSIMLAANGRLNYHLSGSLREFRNLAPSNLILYEAALWGSTNGCKTFHLGGGVGSQEDSLYKFKKAFYRGNPHRFHIGRKIYLQEKYDELVHMRGDLQENAFFPKYRI